MGLACRTFFSTVAIRLFELIWPRDVVFTVAFYLTRFDHMMMFLRQFHVISLDIGRGFYLNRPMYLQHLRIWFAGCIDQFPLKLFLRSCSMVRSCFRHAWHSCRLCSFLIFKVAEQTGEGMEARQRVLKGWRKRWEAQRWQRLLCKFEELRRQRLLERLDNLREKLRAEKEYEDGQCATHKKRSQAVTIKAAVGLLGNPRYNDVRVKSSSRCSLSCTFCRANLTTQIQNRSETLSFWTFLFEIELWLQTTQIQSCSERNSFLWFLCEIELWLQSHPHFSNPIFQRAANATVVYDFYVKSSSRLRQIPPATDTSCDKSGAKRDACRQGITTAGMAFQDFRNSFAVSSMHGKLHAFAALPLPRCESVTHEIC